MNNAFSFDEKAISELGDMILKRTQATARLAVPETVDMQRNHQESDTYWETLIKRDFCQKTGTEACKSVTEKESSEKTDTSSNRPLRGAGAALGTLTGLKPLKDHEYPFSPKHLEYELVSMRDWRLFGLAKRYMLMAVDSTDDSLVSCSLSKFAETIEDLCPVVIVMGAAKDVESVRVLSKQVALDFVFLCPDGDMPVDTLDTSCKGYMRILEGLAEIVVDGRNTVLVHV